MNTVQLPGCGRRTSQLAIGTGRLMGATSKRDSLALLESAFDAGIRHVDTAPSYGIGQSEGCVGEFLGRHIGAVTVTTKYGIPAPGNQSLVGLARGIVRPLIALHPGMKRRLQRLAAAAIKAEHRSYTVAGAQAAVDNSLRALKVDRIEIWLLHEAAREDLQDESLLRFMEENVRTGKIGAFGVGSELAKIPAIYAERKAYCPVIQCEWDPLQPEDAYADRFRIHHSVVQHWMSRLAERMRQDATVCPKWSQETDADLAAPSMLGALLIKAALLSNPGGIILFSSKNKKNIVANANIASEAALNGPAQRLHAIIRREGPSMLARASSAN